MISIFFWSWKVPWAPSTSSTAKVGAEDAPRRLRPTLLGESKLGQNWVLEKRCKEQCKRILEHKTRHCNCRVLILMRVPLEGIVGSFMVVSMYLFHWRMCFVKPVTGASQLLKSKSWSINDTRYHAWIFGRFSASWGDWVLFLNTVTGSRNDTGSVDWKLWAIRSDMDNEVDKAKSCFI